MFKKVFPYQHSASVLPDFYKSRTKEKKCVSSLAQEEPPVLLVVSLLVSSGLVSGGIMTLTPLQEAPGIQPHVVQELLRSFIRSFNNGEEINLKL